jgi:CRP-like cAMP-binding protein
LPTGDVVTREGDRPHGFVLIVSGRALVAVASVERGVLSTGMFFGETALSDGAPEPATVTALTPMRLRVATGREFAELSEVRPFARAFLKALAARQRLAFELELKDSLGAGAPAKRVTSRRMAGAAERCEPTMRAPSTDRAAHPGAHP